VEIPGYFDNSLCYYYKGIKQGEHNCNRTNCPLVEDEGPCYYFKWERTDNIDERKKYAGILADKVERRLAAVKKREKADESIIELLQVAEEAIERVIRNYYGNPSHLQDALDCIARTRKKLIPRWETVEQWEQRTGNKLPYMHLVFYEMENNKNDWYIGDWGGVKSKRNINISRVCVLPEIEEPPDDWEPDYEVNG
jgi:hypothetical protein